MTQVGHFSLELALSIWVPALIAFAAPPRWRFWALGLWILAPVLIALVLAGSEMPSGQASPADTDKLFFGLLLIGSFFALPWLIACSAGYALGAWLRGRRGRPVEDTAPAVATAPPDSPKAATCSPPPVDPAAATLSPPSGWQVAHIGFDHDDLVLDGLAIWSWPWRAEGSEPVTLAHPAHPAQRHRFDIYSVDDGQRATRFAASEVSNGVWAFYRWMIPADAPSGLSADGTLRYEHDLGPLERGRFDASAPVARLYEAGTSALVFDGSAWASSRVVPQPDKSLLLSLEHREQQTIYRLDPATGTFRDLARGRGDHPFAALADTAALALASANDPANAYYGRQVAPDGSLLVELEAVEWSNSHWVRSPRVSALETGRVLVDLWGTDWDAAASFPRGQAVRLNLRRYHHGGGAEVELDLRGERYIVFEEYGAKEGPLSQLIEALEGAASATAAKAGARPTIASPTTARSGWVALLILIATLVSIAAATLLELQFGTQPDPPELTPIPPMPSAR